MGNSGIHFTIGVLALSSPRRTFSAKRLQRAAGSADWLSVDTKTLHQAIKELRAELERVDLAIRRIEVIAEAVSQEQRAAGEAPMPTALPEETSRE